MTRPMEGGIAAAPPTARSALRHVTHIRDLGVAGVGELLERAERLRRAPPRDHLAGRLLGMVFFNPSLRTRTSFEAVMKRGGGDATVLEVGNGVWKLEDRDGVRMDGDRAEHVREAVPVLARYCDALAVRAFSAGVSDADDELDRTINAFRTFSTVPIVSMESAREHPCQGLADLLTLRDRFGATKGLSVTLTWAPHVKPLPKAVPNSFLLSAAAAGCEVRVAHPAGMELPAAVRAEAEAYARASGGSVSYMQDQATALTGSRAVYAKAWGAPGDASLDAWMPTPAHLGRAARDAIFMHCLPVRRDVEVAAAVLDSAASAVVDEAENRFHAQRALLDWVFNG
jgi:N-acetylornithine carbamoyltransferase